MATPISHYGQYVPKSSVLISPVIRKFARNPLEKIDLVSAEIKVLKAISGTVVFSINDFVVKWTKVYRNSQHEFKLHSDDVQSLPFALPLLYGKNEPTFTLPILFGRVLRFDQGANGFQLDHDKEFFETLLANINNKADKNIINSSFHLVGGEEECMMITPRCDGDLEWLIPQLKKRNLSQLVTDILSSVKTSCELLVQKALKHGDLRSRNIYYTITEGKILTLYIADWGQATRITLQTKVIDEYPPFERSVTTMRQARKEEFIAGKMTDWAHLGLGLNPALMTELPFSPEKMASTPPKTRRVQTRLGAHAPRKILFAENLSPNLPQAVEIEDSENGKRVALEEVGARKRVVRVVDRSQVNPAQIPQ